MGGGALGTEAQRGCPEVSGRPRRRRTAPSGCGASEAAGVPQPKLKEQNVKCGAASAASWREVWGEGGLFSLPAGQGRGGSVAGMPRVPNLGPARAFNLGSRRCMWVRWVP